VFEKKKLAGCVIDNLSPSSRLPVATTRVRVSQFTQHIYI
jgi:hypothetical protein